MKKIRFWRLLSVTLSFLGALLFGLCTAFGADAEAVSSNEEAQAILSNLNGTTLVDWQSFYDGAFSNSSAYTKLTRLSDPNGDFDKCLELETLTLKTGNIAVCAANYYDRIASDALKAGDSVLIKVTARAVAINDGESLSDGYFSLALYREAANPSPGFDTKQTVSGDWTVFYVPGTAVEGATRINIRFGYQMQRLQIADFSLINFGDTPLAQLPSGSFALNPDDSVPTLPFFSLMTALDEPAYDSGLSAYPLAKALPCALIGSFSAADSACFGTEDILLFRFVLKAQHACTQLHIRILDQNTVLADMVYPIPVQWTRIELPVRAAALKSVELSHNGSLLLADAAMQNMGATTFEALSLQSGMHMIDSFEDYALPETGIGAGSTVDFVKHGTFLYSIGNGRLTVSDVSNPDSPRVRGVLYGLGNVRQIALCAGGTDVIVTARQNGAYIIDVSDPASPRIRYEYDTVEFATGVYVCENYAYITCRQFGVEIIDISDLDAPKHCSVVRCGEAQSCTASDGRLYVGLWGECRVDIYDVTQPSSPTLLGSAPLNGKGDGMTVITLGDKTYLYAATGQHTENIALTTPLSDLRYGQGNGMDIFDVTDPAKPVWLSTSRTDGRFYYPANDFWETEVSFDAAGHVYVYLISTYNGVYVYNADNPRAPIRLAHITVPVYPGSSLYKKLSSSSRAIIFPYDQDAYTQIPIGAIACDEGRFYLAGVESDLHIFTSEALAHPVAETSSHGAYEPDSGKFYEFGSDIRSEQDFAYFRPGGQVYAVAVCKNRIYAACGEDGIYVLDENLEELAHLETAGFSLDVQIYGEVLYSAEGKGGFAAYDISSVLPVKQWSLSPGGIVRQVRLSPKARFAVLQTDGNRVKIVNLETKVTVVEHATSGYMYFRNLSNSPVAGRYIGFYGNSAQTYWYDFGVNDDYDAPLLVNDLFTVSTIAMAGGYEAAGDFALGTRGGGYILYNPASPGVSSMSALPLYRSVGYFYGKPTLHGNLLVTTDRINGKIYLVDVSDLTAPVLKQTLTVSGNPDVAVMTDDALLLPLGRQGLIKFRPSLYTPQISVSAASGKIHVSISGARNVSPRRYTVLCAVYEGSRLVSAQVAASGFYAYDSAVDLSFAEPQGVSYKVFLWESTDSLRPLCEPFSASENALT